MLLLDSQCGGMFVNSHINVDPMVVQSFVGVSQGMVIQSRSKVATKLGQKLALLRLNEEDITMEGNKFEASIRSSQFTSRDFGHKRLRSHLL